MNSGCWTGPLVGMTLQLGIRTRSDSSFENRLAGHLETGRDSMSDPAIGTVHPKVETNLNQMATSLEKA